MAVSEPREEGILYAGISILRELQMRALRVYGLLYLVLKVGGKEGGGRIGRGLGVLEFQRMISRGTIISTVFTLSPWL